MMCVPVSSLKKILLEDEGRLPYWLPRALVRGVYEQKREFAEGLNVDAQEIADCQLPDDCEEGNL